MSDIYVSMPHLNLSLIVGRSMSNRHLASSACEVTRRVLFGRRLRHLRKAKGWSQETLALESDIARSYVGAVERGQRNIALLNICRLAETLGVSPAKLMTFD